MSVLILDTFQYDPLLFSGSVVHSKYNLKEFEDYVTLLREFGDTVINRLHKIKYLILLINICLFSLQFGLSYMFYNTTMLMVGFC